MSSEAIRDQLPIQKKQQKKILLRPLKFVEITSILIYTVG